MDYKAYALLGILLAGFFAVSASSAAFAQGTITVKTDKDSYATGDTIMVSGNVGTVASGQTTAVIQVFNPNGVVYRFEPINVNNDGSYTYSLKVGGQIGISGQYKVVLTYNGAQQQTTFMFTSNGPPSGVWKPITVTLGGQAYTIQYQITGGTVTAASGTPQFWTLNFTTSTTSDGKLTLQLPRNVIDAKSASGSDTDFIAFADQINTPLNQVSADSQTRTIEIPFAKGTQTIEVLGTSMIPEFGPVAAIVLAIAIVGIIVATTRYSNKISFLPKF